MFALPSSPETTGADLGENDRGAEGLQICGQGLLNVCDHSVSVNMTSFIFAEW